MIGTEAAPVLPYWPTWMQDAWGETQFCGQLPCQWQHHRYHTSFGGGPPLIFDLCLHGHDSLIIYLVEISIGLAKLIGNHILEDLAIGVVPGASEGRITHLSG